MIKYLTNVKPQVKPGTLIFVYSGYFSDMVFQVLHVEDDGDTLAECLSFPTGEKYVGFQHEDYVVIGDVFTLRTVFDPVAQNHMHLYGLATDVFAEQAKYEKRN